MQRVADDISWDVQGRWGAVRLRGSSLALQLHCRSPQGRANHELERQECPKPCLLRLPQHLASVSVHINQMFPENNSALSVIAELLGYLDEMHVTVVYV